MKIFLKSVLVLSVLVLGSAQSASPAAVENPTSAEFFLPDDTAAAQKAFLATVNGLGKGDEVYLCAYSFTWLPLVDALVKGQAAGAKVHLLLDRSESLTPTEKRALGELGTIEVTLTTAGATSKSTGAIFHSKAFVIQHADGSVACWEGSMNFTASGWNEGNTARLFADKIWAARFVSYFAEHKAWALAHPPKSGG